MGDPPSRTPVMTWSCTILYKMDPRPSEASFDQGIYPRIFRRETHNRLGECMNSTYYSKFCTL